MFRVSRKNENFELEITGILNLGSEVFRVFERLIIGTSNASVGKFFFSILEFDYFISDL